MTAVVNCPSGFTVFFHCIVLAFSIFNWMAVIYSFLDRKKFIMYLNLAVFLVQFVILQVTLAIIEERFQKQGSKIFLPLAELPVIPYIIISLTGFVVGVLCIFVFCDRKRRRITAEGIPKENLLLHERALKLQNDTIRLAEMNRQMDIYSEEMQEQIKEREILEAKVNIHAGMNRLLLTSLKAVESNDKSEIETAVSLWRRDALLLCREADRKPIEDMLEDVKSLAKSLNLKFSCSDVTDITDAKAVAMFYKTACECITNAVKHAGADSFSITVKDKAVYFTNNGLLPPDSELELGGGLRAVKRLAEDAGYVLSFKRTDKFSLILTKKER